MKKHIGIRKTILFFSLIVITFLINLPIITMILNSFKSNSEMRTSTHILPQNFTLENYLHLHTQTMFWTQFKNSVIVTFWGTLLSIIVAAFAGFAISRFRSTFISIYSKSLLMLQMFPIILVLIPLFIMFRHLELINTLYSVIILYVTLHLPFAIWMYKGYFDSIPRELEEAARMDGCNRFQTFIKIILPISGSGIAAVAIFSFLFSFNEYLIASIFLKTEDVMTIPVGIQLFMQQYSSDWGSITAAATLTMVPVFLFFLFVQKYFIAGSAAGAVKG
ncbi:carbohydrate ABC transporter permease [Gracilibacillus saliphilus]|uniref:carbohydrate ABC transporter permease n=1 Tax=Gracilibacillus saliphilus TaxID=543890 RepID=UPI0013D50CEA|nr:carbohydrate ABC transporter permease [Gracilibacillus saliphilus]